ncbi:MAG: hypothetical protein LBB42_02480 [Coriobacteriales bacterium]|jgi:hypothetical protein|nr:hypothetical protein [Coriobacteriales bacterium]
MKKYVVLLFAALLLLALVACKEGTVSENDTANVEAASQPSEAPSVSAQTPENADDASSVSKITTREIVFTDRGATLRYPEVLGMDDESVQSEVNDQIKDDALETARLHMGIVGIGPAGTPASVTIDMNYKILLLDSEKITIEFFWNGHRGRLSC